MKASRSADREMRSDALRNRELVVRAAIATFQREGLAVPMATIASDAGVGVGTLYRHFPTREDLLDELTFRSFERMLNHIVRASEMGRTATEVFQIFLRGVIGDRTKMVLPSTGGPAVKTDRTREVQASLHVAIKDVIQRGRGDGTIVRKVDFWDIAWLGATLAQPSRPGPHWDQIALRLLDTYLAGLAVP